MLTIRDTLAGEEIRFHLIETQNDCLDFEVFLSRHRLLALDTESTGLNPYARRWELRLVQIGNATDCYVIPAKFKWFIAGVIMRRGMKWIAHNGPHDIRSLDVFLGQDTGITCMGETFIPSHHRDSRNPQEGGTGHGLKELSIAHIDVEAGKWEKALKAEFKKIEIPMPGVVYKSGPRKGLPRMRKAKLSEGWSLIDPTHPVYIAYAAADPILTFRLWQHFRSTVESNMSLYLRDRRVQECTDRLSRRAILLDVAYTERLSAAYLKRAEKCIAHVRKEYGCDNINSGAQLAETLTGLGVELTERTDKGAIKTDNTILRALMAKARSMRDPETGRDAPEMWLYVEDFIHNVLLAKQLLKRRTAYAEQMLNARDANDRVHPSIKPLAARTTRMSVSDPALQQLPTKNREEDQ